MARYILRVNTIGIRQDPFTNLELNRECAEPGEDRLTEEMVKLAVERMKPQQGRIRRGQHAKPTACVRGGLQDPRRCRLRPASRRLPPAESVVLGMIAGIRLWIEPTSELASVVMMQQVATFSLPSDQTSQSPAKPNGLESFIVKYVARFLLLTVVHS